MKKRFFPFSLASSFLLFSSTIVLAGDPAFTQQVFDVNVNVTPNKMLPIPAKQITADIPIKVISDSDHNIIGLQVGGEKGVAFHYLMNDGTTQDNSMDPTAASSDLYSHNIFKVQMKVPVLGKRDLFYLDGTKIDPVTGGPIVIHYISNPVFNTSNTATINLVKSGNDWTATIPKNADPKSLVRISSMTVKSGTFGLGFKSPQFSYLDPNSLVKSAMNQAPVADPKQAEGEMKVAQQTLEEFQNTPEDLGGGVSVSLNVLSTAAAPSTAKPAPASSSAN